MKNLIILNLIIKKMIIGLDIYLKIDSHDFINYQKN